MFLCALPHPPLLPEIDAEVCRVECDARRRRSREDFASCDQLARIVIIVVIFQSQVLQRDDNDAKLVWQKLVFDTTPGGASTEPTSAAGTTARGNGVIQGTTWQRSGSDSQVPSGVQGVRKLLGNPKILRGSIPWSGMNCLDIRRAESSHASGYESCVPWSRTGRVLALYLCTKSESSCPAGTR